MNEWKIAIQHEVGIMGYALYIYRKNHNGTTDFKTPNGDINVKHGALRNESLFMCIFEDTSQLRELIEQAEKQGVQAPSTATALGRLEATERHLQDLRKLIPKLNQRPDNA